MRARILGIIFVATALWVSTTFAAPSKIAHQGRLLNAQGQPITTTLAVSFAIFDIASGGLPVWSETQNITPDASGFYETYLGNSVALPPTLPEPSYLEIVIDSEFLSPRLEFGSVPFSLQAGDISCSGCVVSADISSGTIVDANVSSTAAIAGTKINPDFGNQNIVTTGNVGIGTSSPAYNLEVTGTVRAGQGIRIPVYLARQTSSYLQSSNPTYTPIPGLSVSVTVDIPSALDISFAGLVYAQGTNQEVYTVISVDGSWCTDGLSCLGGSSSNPHWNTTSNIGFVNVAPGSHLVEVRLYCGPGTGNCLSNPSSLLIVKVYPQ